MPRYNKLTDDQVEAIRELFDADPRPTYEHVAGLYSLHPDTVRKIVNFQRRLPVSERRGDARSPPGHRLTVETVRAIRLAFFEPGEDSRPVNLAKRFRLNVSTIHHYLRRAHPDERKRP